MITAQECPTSIFGRDPQTMTVLMGFRFHPATDEENPLQNEVVLSLSPQFTVQENDDGRHIWMVKTPENMRLAETMRSSKRFSSVTVFIDLGGSVENVISMLPTLTEHHPKSDRIFVRGINSQAAARIYDEISSEWLAEHVDDELILRRKAKLI
ncbi:hypothetical protein [Rhizobium jaguaris]|uniref:Uncharacterized protein n=1 Tax=Rhizobium jaguaris TaxID=1312183 RepID=A0A387FU30_9HYPH|nr:hypothetical protein [Rhizobium jaguaris]AYG62179.1 hypothetical protein CCGE525_25430 [Rhizobium jaguaris]